LLLSRAIVLRKMGFTKYTSQAEKERVRMNEGIRAREVRVIGPEGPERRRTSPCRSDTESAGSGARPYRNITECRAARVQNNRLRQIQVRTKEERERREVEGAHNGNESNAGENRNIRARHAHQGIEGGRVASRRASRESGPIFVGTIQVHGVQLP